MAANHSDVRTIWQVTAVMRQATIVEVFIGLVPAELQAQHDFVLPVFASYSKIERQFKHREKYFLSVE